MLFMNSIGCNYFLVTNFIERSFTWGKAIVDHQMVQAQQAIHLVEVEETVHLKSNLLFHLFLR